MSARVRRAGALDLRNSTLLGLESKRSGTSTRATHSPRRNMFRHPPALCVLRTPPFLCGLELNCVGIGYELMRMDAQTPTRLLRAMFSITLSEATTMQAIIGGALWKT